MTKTEVLSRRRVWLTVVGIVALGVLGCIGPVPTPPAPPAIQTPELDKQIEDVNLPFNERMRLWQVRQKIRNGA